MVCGGTIIGEIRSDEEPMGLSVTQEEFGMLMLEEQSHAPQVPCIHALSGAQREILEMMHDSGGACIAQTGRVLGVTPSAVRQRLMQLAELGLVTARTENSGTRGRPRMHYRLTAAARMLISQHGNAEAAAFARAVLQEVQRRNPELVASVMSELAPDRGRGTSSGAARDVSEAWAAAGAS